MNYFMYHPEQFLQVQLTHRLDDLLKNTKITFEVYSVINEMINDIEVWDATITKLQLEQEIEKNKSEIIELREREEMLILEKQTMEDRMYEIGEKAKGLGAAFRGQLKNLNKELAHKKELEQQLAEAHSNLEASAHISRELSRAQREIRELRRQQSLQSLLNTTSSKSTRRLTSPPKLAEKQRQNSEQPSFFKLKDALLLLVFTGLEANDVLSVSITCTHGIHRSNRLFGMQFSILEGKGIRKKAILGTTTKSNEGKSERKKSPKSPLKWKSKTKISGPFSAPARNQTEKIQLSRADQIVKSLNHTEMKLFHELMTRVKQLEVSIGQLQTEKEDLGEKLQGAESVKDFLMDKLKEVEETLATSIDENNKIQEKAASDHEVIGYLDIRTQELEKEVRILKDKNKGLIEENLKQTKAYDNKLKMTEDLHTLLLSEKTELEVQYKSQRKLLIREVKTLRSQQQQIMKERDEYRDQLIQLKNSLLGLDSLNIR